MTMWMPPVVVRVDTEEAYHLRTTASWKLVATGDGRGVMGGSDKLRGGLLYVSDIGPPCKHPQ